MTQPSGPPTGPQNPPKLLNTREAAERLGMGYDWLRDKVKARAVPFTQFSTRAIRFSEQDLADIIAAHRVTPRSAPAARIAQGRRIA